MTVTFPTTLDTTSTFPSDIAGDEASTQLGTANVELDNLLNDLGNAIRALEAKVGIDASAVITSLDYLVKQASNPGHTHTAYAGIAEDETITGDWAFNGTNAVGPVVEVTNSSRPTTPSGSGDPAFRISKEIGSARIDFYETGGADDTVDAAGGPIMYINGGDIIGVRNIQGGVAADPNLDIGGGSAVDRGRVTINYDNGDGFIVFDGREARVADFNDENNGLIRLYDIVQVSLTLQFSGDGSNVDPGNPWMRGATDHLVINPSAGGALFLAFDAGTGGINLGNGAGETTGKWVPTGALKLKDGITAPDAESGFASIYVDTADGDLKVKFGDGTTKVLAADT